MTVFNPGPSTFLSEAQMHHSSPTSGPIIMRMKRQQYPGRDWQQHDHHRHADGHPVQEWHARPAILFDHGEASARESVSPRMREGQGNSICRFADIQSSARHPSRALDRPGLPADT